MKTPLPAAARRLATAAALVALGTASIALTAAPADAATSAPAGSASPAKHHHRTSYVALGDSFAAGEGLPKYERGTDTATATDHCHRSKRQSYPELLERSRVQAFNHLTSVACSGAITGSLFRQIPAVANEPPQLDAVHRSTKTVTVSIGGNDAGFSQVLQACIHPAAAPANPGCSTLLNTDVPARIAYLASRTDPNANDLIVPLPVIIAAIHTKAPHAEIYVSGNPQLLGTTLTPPYGCQVGSAGSVPLVIDAADALLIRQRATELAAATARSVALAHTAGIPVHFVDVGKRFDGHNLCDAKTPWLNPVSLNSADPTDLNPASFHPTARGQQAYARAFLRVAEQVARQSHRQD